MRVKWLWSAKPARAAISAIDKSLVSSASAAHNAKAAHVGPNGDAVARPKRPYEVCLVNASDGGELG